MYVVRISSIYNTHKPTRPHLLICIFRIMTHAYAYIMYVSIFMYVYILEKNYASTNKLLLNAISYNEKWMPDNKMWVNNIMFSYIVYITMFDSL